METIYDVIVVGAGHAGCEAAHAAARIGCRTLLLTIDLDKLAHMSCNPSIGGPAKGHIVREVDALGGVIGRVTDDTLIQMRMLNDSKGPAVQALRAQCDKRLYAQRMKEVLERTPNLDLKQAMVTRILAGQERGIENGERRIKNEADLSQFTIHNSQFFKVVTHTGWVYRARALVLTTGTFLRGRAITGESTWSAGRAGESAAVALGEDLHQLGFPLVRLKTGTPPRIDARTIDWSLTERQQGSRAPLYFGHYYGQPPAPPAWTRELPNPVYPDPQLDGWRPQLPCYLVYSTPEMHAVINTNLDRAPLFSGMIEGVGPRYCPSIEDKIVRFADKERHGFFLEPEGWQTSEVYVQGCNTSLPEDVQWQMLRAIPALRDVEIVRVGYAIEYDAVATGEVTATLETKRMPGLFLAGQINGTTGYEEAAAQGIVAGINAALGVRGEAPFILRRDEAYIGVLVDDLVTKEIHEPYRMFTSRAEYRLLLRSDNADLRLTPHAYRLGIVDGERMAQVEAKAEGTAATRRLLGGTRLTPSGEVNARLHEAGIDPISQVCGADVVLTRPAVSYTMLRDALPELPELPSWIAEQVELETKYAGYIDKQERSAERVRKMEGRRIPDDFDLQMVSGLRNEARQVLARFRPATLGQAARLAGINPADVAVLLVHLERQRPERAIRE